jgi:MATE family multidrug resistance protein
MGFASSLETLCGQAYGAKQYEMLGIYLQRGLFVLHITAIPFAFVYGYMGQILVCLGQTRTISYEAGKFARWMIPALFAQASAQPLIRFLQAQSLVYPMMATSVLSVVCHVPLCWSLVYETALGFEGAAISMSICNWINAILLYLYVGFSPSCRRTRASLSWEALHGTRSFLHLALPSTAMVWYVNPSFILSLSLCVHKVLYPMVFDFIDHIKMHTHWQYSGRGKDPKYDQLQACDCSCLDFS